jgi:hypothetical protein
MSYNNSTYIGIRKQVTQHLYKFFFGIYKLFLHQKQFQTSSLETTVDQHTRGKLCERSISSKISKSKCLCNGLDRFCIISAWWCMDQAGNTYILNSIWSYIAFSRNMFSNELIAPLFCANGKFGMLADSI